MKITKHTSLFIFLITLVNVILCQNVTKKERIFWNPIPDTISVFYPLFNKQCYDEDYNAPVYVNSYTFPKKVYSIHFSNITYENITSQEKLFLNKKGICLTDTIKYKVYLSSAIENKITLAILPYILKDGEIKRITSYFANFETKDLSQQDSKNKKNSNTYPSNSILSTGSWYKVGINSTGIYRITPNDILSKEKNISSIPISQIAVYGNGGGALSENNNNIEYNDLIENAIYIKDDNNNGLFDNNDYLLFYGQAADIWKYNHVTSRFEYQVHPYSKYNFYYLTISFKGTKRITPISISSTSNDKISSYTYCTTIHNDQTNTHKSGRIWVGEKFSNSMPLRYFSIPIPNAVPETEVDVRYALASISSTNSSFSVSINGTNQTHQHTPGYRYPYQGYSVKVPSTDKCDIEIRYSFRESMATGYLDFIDINANSNLLFSSGQMPFRNTQNIGVNNTSLFEISNSTPAVRVWNVSDPCNAYEVFTYYINNKTIFADSTTKIGEFIAFDDNSFLSPTSIISLTNQNLHGLSQQDYIIVAPTTFLDEAERLAQLHRLYNGLNVTVVTPEQIYNEFSSGKQDAMAIRRFMKMFYDRALSNNVLSAPRYLLLFGKAVYDNKNITNTDVPYIVSYQSETSFDDDGASYTSDDMFGYLDNWETGSVYESIDIGIGRFPVKTQSEAKIMVDKVE